MPGEIALFSPMDAHERALDELREENEKLSAALRRANQETAQARAEAARALAALRKQLSPLYCALQAVFGELDAAGVEDAPGNTAPAASTRTSAIWDSWKSRQQYTRLTTPRGVL